MRGWVAPSDSMPPCVVGHSCSAACSARQRPQLSHVFHGTRLSYEVAPSARSATPAAAAAAASASPQRLSLLQQQLRLHEEVRRAHRRVEPRRLVELRELHTALCAPGAAPPSAAGSSPGTMAAAQ